MSRPTVAALLLFVSGIAALIYQIIWIKQLTLVVGVDVYAITTGVSGFFTGLAFGSFVFGKMADRSASPVRIYAVLEIGIAILGIVTTVLLASAPQLFVNLQSAIGPIAWALPFVLVAVPASLMGGTLPPLLAMVRPDEQVIGKAAGRLYAANTAGAIVGALITILAVIPMFGIQGAARFAAVLNVILAGAAYIAVIRPGAAVVRRDSPLQKDQRLSREVRLALALYAAAGGIALGYEVVWTQVIVQFLSTKAVAFGVVLATYLLGLVVGSWFFSRRADRVVNRWSVFGWLVGGAGVAAMATFAMLGPWLPAAQDSIGSAIGEITGSRMLEMCTRFAVAAGTLVLPATVLLGAAFPAAARLIVQSDHAGRDIGYVLALNTACGVLGTVITGFLLIPVFGLAGSLGLLAVCSALIAAIAIGKESAAIKVTPRRAVTLVVIVAIAAFMLPRDKLATMLAEDRGGEVVFYDEGPGGTVAVIEQTTTKGSFRRLYIQGVSNSGDVMPSKRYMRMQGLLPLMIHAGEPKSAAVIAFGTGITAGSLLAYPELDRRLVIELLQPVVDAATLFDGNLGAASDPRLEIVIADGRHELMRRDESFDLITLEPPPPAAAGVVNLYSRDFYRLASQRLNENGLLAQWLPINTQNEEDTQSLIKSMLDVFPHLTLWTTEVHEMMVIGSMQPMPFDYKTISERVATNEVATAFTEIGINSANDLLATYITDRKGLEFYVGNALPVTDDQPRIEYASWIRAMEITRVLPNLLALRKPPPVVVPEIEKRRIEASHARLANFYEISISAYSGDRDAWEEQVERFSRDRSPNAYYDWNFPRR